MARHLTKQQKLRIQDKRNEKIDPCHLNTHDLQIGRVITQHGAHIMLEDQEHKPFKAHVRQNLGTIVCGDFVHFLFEQDTAVVVNVVVRKNILSRLGFGGREKPFAANIDQVIIVIAPKPEPSPSLLDRYLIAIRQFSIPILFVINKSDLSTNQATFQFINEYHKIFGYQVINTSIKEPASIERLQQECADKTSILVGQSGVGKSSLTNQLIPEIQIQTQQISATTGLGNHTTSNSTLYHLPTSGFLIDSPGVRSFNIDHLTPAAVKEGFPELLPYIQACRFRNCRHLQDPGCALTEGLQKSELSQRRIESYLQINKTLAQT